MGGAGHRLVGASWPEGKGAEVLEKLDEVAWVELTHAYGNATDVPGLLRQLAALDPLTADAAVGALFGNIWHQGTVYQATAPAVPFLLELVADPAVHARDGLLHLLAVIATGSPVYGDEPEDPWLGRSWRPPGDTDEGREQARAWVRAAYQAVVAGVPMMLGLLGDPNVAVRRMVPYTLAACRDQARELVPALAACLPHEPDPAAKASIVLAATTLAGEGGTTDADTAWLAGLLGDGQAAPVRLAAAVGLAWSTPSALPDGVVATMAATLADRSAAELTRLAWCTDWVEALAFDALGERIPARVELVLRLLQAGDAEVRQRATLLAGSLLRGWRSPSVRLLPALAALLRDPHEQVRAATARQLADAPPEAAAVADALAAALGDPTPDVADSALVALARLADPRCLPALQAALQQPAPASDEPAELLIGGRPLAIAAALRGPGLLERVAGLLGPMHAHAAELLPLVRQRLRDLPDSNALVSLLSGVQDLGPAAAEVVPELVELLNRPLHRDHVIQILGGMGPAAAPAGPALRPFLTHQDPMVALAAAQALWQITGDRRLVLPTLRRLQDHPLGRVSGGAAMALWQITGQTGPALAVLDAALHGEEPDLAGALGESDWRLASPVLLWEWLGELRTAAAPLAPRLRALLTHPKRWVRLHAAIAVWQVASDHDAALPVLRDAVATAPPWVGVGVVAYLGEIGPPARTAARVLQALLDRDRRYVVDDLALRASAVQQDHTARATITAALQRILGGAAS